MTHKNIDFSNFNNVFCDSKEALEWAYEQGLPEDAIIRSSSPAVLWGKNDKIKHLESRWNISEMQDFQESIHKFSKDIFHSVKTVNGIENEQALCLAKASVAFQRVIFKAACITEADLTERRLILQVDTSQCGSRDVLNPPWKDLLNCNPNAYFALYSLKDSNWGMLTTRGVSKWKRMYIAGLNTILFRVLLKLEKYLPCFLFKKQILIPNENELSVEILSSLALKGCKLTKIESNKINVSEEKEFSIINKTIKPIVSDRMKRWVVPGLVETCEKLFFNEANKRLNLYSAYVEQWNCAIPESITNKNRILLINSPVSTKWLALVNVCRCKGVPVVSVQHGVTQEINPSKENNSALDINASDCFIAYNEKSAEVALNSEFSPGKAYVSGISGRHLRMKKFSKSGNCKIPIVYISTRMYNGNMGGIATWLTDYDVANWEYSLISKVFNELPHKTRYKTYPEETRRYSDLDPLIESVKNNCNNVEVFDKKIDMRFLINQHQVFVTSFATSTVSWVIASEKPVVFIDSKNSGALSKDAYSSFKKGIFLFNDAEVDFHIKLRRFLSKPIEEIQSLWDQKKIYRNAMINDFFTPYGLGAGKRAAAIIIKEYL